MGESKINELEKRVEELNNELNALRGELIASMRREELLLNSKKDTKTLKERLKKTWVGREASNPNSKVGKIIRIPRTVCRLIRHPSILLEITGIKRTDGKIEKESEKNIFAPIKFFRTEDNTRRLNLVLEKMDSQIVAEAVKFANQNDYELRVVTCAEKVDPLKFNKIIKDNNLKNVKDLSFYSSFDQVNSKDPFRLEVGKNDVFLTTVWNKDE